MSFDSRTVSVVNNTNTNVSTALYTRDTHFNSAVRYTSSLVVNLRQLQTDLNAQHQHEKHALDDLNKHFRLFVDRVRQLESQNSKYITKIADFRRQSSNANSIDTEWDERYFRLQSDLTTASSAKADFVVELELFQWQIGIYQQLIDGEQEAKDKRRLKLEQDLQQSSSALNTIRASYAQLEREVKNFYAAREDILKQHLKLTYDWRSVKKQKKEWELNRHTLMSKIEFYKRLRSYSVREFKSSSVQSIDDTQFWKLELDKSVQKIRHDFGELYGRIHREMAAYYEANMKEVKLEFEQRSQYTPIENEELTRSIQTLLVKYEEVQKSFSSEQQILIKLEATHSKFQSEFQSIQLQNDERIEVQSKDLLIVQENIMAMAYEIEEMRRSKIHLETEIIIYRNLLGNGEIPEQGVIDLRPSSLEKKMTGKFMVKNLKKGSIGLKCAPNGAYISLTNHSTNRDIDISRWVVKRRIDSAKELRYTIPDGVRLQKGKELKIYSKLGLGTAESASNQRAVSSSCQELMNSDLVSWGVGNTIETSLFNQNGEEKASHSQSLAFGMKRI